jgi:hypothetical protein
MLGNDFGHYVTRLEAFMRQVMERKNGPLQLQQLGR